MFIDTKTKTYNLIACVAGGFFHAGVKRLGGRAATTFDPAETKPPATQANNLKETG